MGGFFNGFKQKIKLLQVIYAGALTDSVLRFGNEEILNKVTLEKREEQMKTGKYRAAQFGIEKPEEVFLKLSELFGCANWVVENENESLNAEATRCMLTFSIWSVIYSLLITSVIVMIVKKDDYYYKKAVEDGAIK